MAAPLPVFPLLASERIVRASGCDPIWQHVARLRELRLVCELMPPPRA